MVNGLTLDSNWNTTGTGSEVAIANAAGGRIRLREAADIRPGRLPSGFLTPRRHSAAPSASHGSR
jgi:hypothetical protein